MLTAIGGLEKRRSGKDSGVNLAAILRLVKQSSLGKDWVLSSQRFHNWGSTGQIITGLVFGLGPLGDLFFTSGSERTYYIYVTAQFGEFFRKLSTRPRNFTRFFANQNRISYLTLAR